MIDKKDLGKIKYVYRIYSSEDKIIHCERHPIIYINSNVVYFKDSRKQEWLTYIMTKSVIDEFMGINEPFYTYAIYDKYYWKVENFDSKKSTEEAYSLNSKNDLDSAKTSMERAAREYQMKKEKYEKLSQE